MSKIAILGTPEAEKLHISRWPKYCETPCMGSVHVLHLPNKHSAQTHLVVVVAMPTAHAKTIKNAQKKTKM